jgi:beta-glucosidase
MGPLFLDFPAMNVILRIIPYLWESINLYVYEMKKQLIFICGLLLMSACSAERPKHTFQDPDKTIDERVDNLIALMTIEEKIAQMMNNAPAIERLGIPAYNWWNEALHGVARSPYPATSFPQAIGMAATWNTDAVRLMAEYVSDEGRAIYHDSSRKGKTGIFLGLTYWTPNINIFRDPRWGRGQETYGEDPFLTSAVGASFVKGLQGDDPVYLKASACAKHFAVHSGPEWNRHTYNAEVSNFDLWDTYLPAFRELVVEAKVTGVMCAYNAFFGQPCCGSDLLMMDILKDQWHFNGYVTSDCGAIDDFYKTHETHPGADAASADAVLHGTDCECGGSYTALADALGNGLITEEAIDASLRRLFTIRFRLGMFDPDDRVPYAATPISVIESPQHKEHALKMAQESIVLLKNENNLLPLDKSKIKKIAVTGPNADSESVLLANYYGYPTEVTTLLEGIRRKVGNGVEVLYEKGVNLTDDYVFTSEYDDALFTVDGQQGFKASYYQNLQREGEPVLSRIEARPDYQWGDGQDISEGLIARRMSAAWSTVYTPKESGDVCFELKADDWAELFIDGVRQEKTGNINAYYPLKAESGKSYKVDIYYRQYADNAEISLDLGTLRMADSRRTAAALADADVIIFAGGISAKVEGEEMGVVIDGFKRGDRTSIDLPAVQKELLRELKATGKPVVFVLMTGSAIGLGWESDNIPAILNAWYGGQAGGEAIADVLFGDYNPAGRLPVTFYRSTDDLPDFEDYSMVNRTYRYFKGTPVYPFGYGLSYTTFDYGEAEVAAAGDQSLTVKATVTNTGSRDGDEVVQLYVSNKRDFLTPIRSLKGFKRIHLRAGESQTVEFQLAPDDLSVVNVAGHMEPMKGEVVISVGGGQPVTTARANIKSSRKLITL